jgi:hypothetical protein
MRRGVGAVYGIPVLKYGERRYSARAVSESLTREGAFLDQRRISRKQLEELGIGPLGRFIDGEPIRPIRLRPRELLCRGGEALEGFWTDFEIPRDRWLSQDTAEAVFTAHLELLRRYGISGGIILEDRRRAALTAAYLAGLAGKIGDGRAVLVSPRDYYESRLRQVLPPFIPVTLAEGGISLFSPRFRGTGVCFSGDLPASRRKGKFRWDLALLAEPEKLLEDHEPEYLRELGRLRLGIFGSPPPPENKKLRILFEFRGRTDLEKYLLRNAGEALPLPPRSGVPLRRILRPPEPFGTEPAGAEQIWGGGRFVIEGKFKNIRTPEYKNEQAAFFEGGKPAPLAAYAVSIGELRFDGLNREQRAFFLYWRGEFRRGRIIETFDTYIFLYARELILSMGNTEPMYNFRELLRLWRSYREVLPELDARCSRWLLDYAVLYHICSAALGELVSFGAGEAAEPLRDLMLHERYIERSEPLLFSDLEPLLPEHLRGEAFYSGPGGSALRELAERALRLIDQHLREEQDGGLLALFYPSRAPPVLITGFESLPGLGYSSYTGEWMGFSRHRPLIAFLRDLVLYLACRTREETGFRRGGSRPFREPPLEDRWKFILHRGLGLPGEAPPPPRREIILENRILDQLRRDSDAVRELLRLDRETAEAPEKTAPSPGPRLALPAPLLLPPPEMKTRRKSSGAAMAGDPLTAFLASRPSLELDFLALLSRGAGTEEIRELARKQSAMPELILEAINNSFHESFMDILIDTLDEGPVISAEYAAGVRQFLRLRGLGDTGGKSG